MAQNPSRFVTATGFSVQNQGHSMGKLARHKARLRLTVSYRSIAVGYLATEYLNHSRKLAEKGQKR